MIAICYHNGAMGNTLGALLSCCTKEGNSEFPSFLKGQHLHHFSHSDTLYKLKHPDINIKFEQSRGNTVVHSTSKSVFGKLLILTMSLHKWDKAIPEFNKPGKFNQGNGTYGEQLEILSDTLKDKIVLMNDEYVDADIEFDIMWFWQNPKAIEKFIIDCGLTPIREKIYTFVKEIVEINSDYYHSIEKCLTVAEDAMHNKNYKCDLSFFEVAIVRMLIANNKTHRLYLLNTKPHYVDDFKKLFKG